MDAIFYNDKGDRFYGGKQFTFTLEGTTAGQVIPDVPFKFMQLSETNGILSWDKVAFTPTGADAPLEFALVPQQFIGTGSREIRGLAVISNVDGIRWYNSGQILIDVAAQTLTFFISAARIQPVADNYISARACYDGTAYVLEAGSITYERIFS